MLLWMLAAVPLAVMPEMGIVTHGGTQVTPEIPPVDGWCGLDSGRTAIIDSSGHRHDIHVSVTRSGSVWIRLGQDYASMDWSLVAQRRPKVQAALLTDETISLLQSLGYSDFCVLTDVELRLNLEGSWNPSYVTVFAPGSKETRILSIRNIRDCLMNTTLASSVDRQGLRCDGGRLNTCGVRNMPDRSQASPTWFVKYVNFDLAGADHWFCPGLEDRTWFTLTGSYYHAYVKMATCDKPNDSRVLGYEATLRSHNDSIRNSIILPDPSQTFLSDSVVRGWQLYVKVLSVEHSVYLQVWRPDPTEGSAAFRLVGQTFAGALELRFQEIRLEPERTIEARKGDVLGFYFPLNNPIAWSNVPCSAKEQQHLFHRNPPRNVTSGTRLTFSSSSGEQSTSSPCRFYSLVALLANKSDFKVIEDWTCPIRSSALGSYRRANVDPRTPPVDRSVTPFHEPPTVHHRKPSRDGQKTGRHHHDNAAPPVYLILSILAILLVVMIAIGMFSYFKSVRSTT